MSYKITISTDFEDINLSLVHRYLSDSYWAKNIPFETLKKAIKNSLCFSVLNEKVNQTRTQIGFARMITDKASYAYLADVFILQEHRGFGISKQLMKAILAHPDLQGLRRMTLATRDAHSLYEQFGFKALANPNTFMELWVPDVYQ